LQGKVLDDIETSWNIVDAREEESPLVETPNVNRHSGVVGVILRGSEPTMARFGKKREKSADTRGQLPGTRWWNI